MKDRIAALEATLATIGADLLNRRASIKNDSAPWQAGSWWCLECHAGLDDTKGHVTMDPRQLKHGASCTVKAILDLGLEAAICEALIKKYERMGIGLKTLLG